MWHKTSVSKEILRFLDPEAWVTHGTPEANFGSAWEKHLPALCSSTGRWCRCSACRAGSSQAAVDHALCVQTRWFWGQWDASFFALYPLCTVNQDLRSSRRASSSSSDREIQKPVGQGVGWWRCWVIGCYRAGLFLSQCRFHERSLFSSWCVRAHTHACVRASGTIEGEWHVNAPVPVSFCACLWFGSGHTFGGITQVLCVREWLEVNVRITLSRKRRSDHVSGRHKISHWQSISRSKQTPGSLQWLTGPEFPFPFSHHQSHYCLVSHSTSPSHWPSFYPSFCIHQHEHPQVFAPACTSLQNALTQRPHHLQIFIQMWPTREILSEIVPQAANTPQCSSSLLYFFSSLYLIIYYIVYICLRFWFIVHTLCCEQCKFHMDRNIAILLICWIPYTQNSMPGTRQYSINIYWMNGVKSLLCLCSTLW